MQLSQQEAAQRLLMRRQARRQLIDFVGYTTPNWAAGKIHREICSALDAVQRKEVDRLILLCPPQHGKSKIASERFPAYRIGREPTCEVISASASQNLAERFGGSVRNCVRSLEYQALFPGVSLRDDSTAKGAWATEQGGGYYAVGIGGALYGRGAHLGVIDDPFGSWQDAQSETERRNVCEWYTGTFYNRIRPGGAIVVIQHRMHEEDLVGWLLNHEARGGDSWKVVKLPADLDNPPWPERYDREALERIKRNTFPREWASLYMQEPSPEEGLYFKRDSFNRYRDAPSRLNIYITGDFAVSDGQGDYTFLIVWGVDQFNNCYVLDIWYGQKTVNVWIKELLDRVEHFKPQRFVGESGVIRKAVEPFLIDGMTRRNLFVGCEWLPTNADKPALARSFQGLCEMGRVYLPGTTAADELINQCVGFPGGRYDDGVDACSIFGRFISRVWKADADEQVPADRLAEAWNKPMTIREINGRQ